MTHSSGGDLDLLGLAADGLEKSFGGLVAVAGLSLEVKRGSVCGLIGPNGAGKSTLLNLLSGVLKPSKGRVLLGGTDVTSRSASGMVRSGVRRTFQHPRLIPDVTIFENVLAGTRRRKVDPDPYEAAAAALNRVGIALSQWDNHPAKVSPQVHRWIEVARALASAGDVYLFDEPTAGFGEEERSRFTGLATELAERDNAAVLIVSHDVAFTMRVSDWIVAMDHGAKIADGPADVVMTDPKVREVYLGSAAIQAISSVLDGDADRRAVEVSADAAREVRADDRVTRRAD